MARNPAFPHFKMRQRLAKKTRDGSVMRLGTDLVWIPEIERSILQFGDRYLRRMFSEQELQDCHSARHQSYASLAARVAAKEATMKILGLNKDTALPWNSIEVVRRTNGSTGLRLHREAQTLARVAGLDDYILSLSHEHEYAIATVIATSIVPHQKTTRITVRN
ncbi:holo-ACP synthase [Undibacterium sp. SXout11W]|uniref:holo-ACP synthase n=1 Tax=Undibacterium sp. SXout11W TaxID=3413050 RepID=UPI003BF246E4